MTVEEQVRLVQRFAASLGSGSMDIYDELVTEEFLQHTPGVSSGRQAVKDLVLMLREAFPDIRNTLEEVIVAGDKVATYGYVSGTHRGVFMGIPPTGKFVRTTSMNLFRIKEGKLAEHWEVADNLGLLQQIGALQSL